IPVLDVAPKTPTKGTKWKGPDGTVWMGDGKEWKPINTTIPPGGPDFTPIAKSDPTNVVISLPTSSSVPPGVTDYLDEQIGAPVKVDDRNGTMYPVLPVDVAFASSFFSGPNEFWYKYGTEFFLKI